jgi:hypothetical protein
MHIVYKRNQASEDQKFKHFLGVDSHHTLERTSCWPKSFIFVIDTLCFTKNAHTNIGKCALQYAILMHISTFYKTLKVRLYAAMLFSRKENRLVSCE